MYTWLINRWDSFRTGFWFFPTLLMAGAVVLAILVPEFDRQSSVWTPGWLKTTGASARGTLTALASAMFTVAGVVFSVTVVTLSITSSQFGPRLLRNFLEESITQITLGGCLASSIYCLILLWRIDDAGDAWFVPHLAVFLATLMTLAALCSVVYFIHRVAHSVQSMNVVNDVAADLDDAITRLFPDKIGEGRQHRNIAQSLVDRFELERTTSVTAAADGYLQAINGEVLVAGAKEHKLIVQLKCRPGDFLIRGHEIARCLPAEHCDESVAESIGKAFLTGNRRTPRQDVECAVDELVEVAVRALSPGINDPFTAVASIDRLCATFCRLSKRDVSAAVRFAGDDADEPLVIATPTEFSSVLNAGFDQIRQHGSSSVAVSIRILEALERIAITSTCRGDRQAIRRQAEMVIEGCRSQSLCSGDMDDIEERFDRVAMACGRGSSAAETNCNEQGAFTHRA